MVDRSVCTGDKKQINDSLEPMHSGHTAAAVAGFVFLYLYLNAELRVFANYYPAMWKLIAISAPLLDACLSVGALAIDEYRNWYDVFAGACIGALVAFSSCRTPVVYASIAVGGPRGTQIPHLKGPVDTHNHTHSHRHSATHIRPSGEVHRKPIGAHRHADAMV